MKDTTSIPGHTIEVCEPGLMGMVGFKCIRDSDRKVIVDAGCVPHGTQKQLKQRIIAICRQWAAKDVAK